MLATTFVQRYVQQFARSMNRMLVYSITGIILTACTALFSFLLIPARGVYGFVMAMILSNLVAAGYTFLFSGAFRYCCVKAVRKSRCLEMLKYSIPLVPNGIMWWVVNALNRPVMESYSGMDAIGIFAAANKFPGIVTVIFSVFATSWQISVMEEFGKDGYAGFYNKMFRLVVFVLMLVFFAITFGSKIIVSILQPDYHQAWMYIPVLALGAVFSSISGFAGCNFSATRESKYYFYSSLWSALVAVGLNFLLIPKFGIMGAAVAVSVSFAVMAAARIMYAWKYVKIQKPKLYIFILFTGIASIVAMLLIQSVWWKTAAAVLLLSGFLCANYDMKESAVALYRKIKIKIKR
jgi:O-antigen/teichoic acid export membrane protein